MTKAKGAKTKSPSRWRHEISAGGLIWRELDGQIEVVLVRPAGRGTWVLPKGHVEPGEGVVEAALREASEETGLIVAAGISLGDVSYVYSWRDLPNEPPIRIFKRVYFFLMECRGGDPTAHDAEIDEVAWMGIAQALTRASHRSERNLIAKARDLLGSSP
ncbi:MAG: NUDIX hydrolase [Candidatus Acidiferrales bacterium]